MNNYLKAGEIHKQIQEYARTIVLPGTNMMTLANQIEDKIRELTQYDPLHPLKAGIAFPTGLSINNCAAHWTPNKNDTDVIFQDQDIIKVDFGVQIEGCIVDGAISITQNDVLTPLVKISEEANAIAIKSAGVDAYVYDIGCNVQEFIESNEIDIDGRMVKINSIQDLCGHQIGKYMIHTGKPVPNVRFDAIKNNERYRMKAGEIYALEPYPTTGSGSLTTDTKLENCSHFMANYNDHKKYNVASRHKWIAKQFDTLAFCRRWLPDDISNLDQLVAKGIYSAHPPLYTEKGTFVAQTEKTIYVTENGVKILN